MARAQGDAYRESLTSTAEDKTRAAFGEHELPPPRLPGVMKLHEQR